MKPAKLAGAPSKLDLIRWADDRRDVDLQSKVILQKLAFFAQDDGDTWAKVETLADAANCSIRTAQSRLKALKEDGYLADTGRLHRLKKSTRSVPIYILKPTIEAEMAALSMGAELAPIEPHGCKTGGGMGATARVANEALEAIENSNEFSTRASAQGDDYSRVEAAFPRLGLGFTNPAVARLALADVLGSGVTVQDLVAAAVAYGLSPMLKRRDFGPVSLQRWLGEGRYRAWLPAAEVAPSEADPPRTAFAGPAGLRAAIVLDPALGYGWAKSWLDRCAWDPEHRVLTPATGEAQRRLPAASDHFRDADVRIGELVLGGKS